MLEGTSTVIKLLLSSSLLTTIFTILSAITCVCIARKSAKLAQDRTLGMEYLSERFRNLSLLRKALSEKKKELDIMLKKEFSNAHETEQLSSDDSQKLTIELINYHSIVEAIIEEKRFYFSDDLYIKIQNSNQARITLNLIYDKFHSGNTGEYEGFTYQRLCKEIHEFLMNTAQVCEDELIKVRNRLDQIASV